MKNCNDNCFPPLIPENENNCFPQPCECPPYILPPVPSVCEGQSLYQAVNNLTHRVNICINTYNSVMGECYKTLHNLQNAAGENGAFYGKKEVWIEDGYDSTSGSKYKIIHKAHLDRNCRPIKMELKLAYNNTTNSKITETIANASKSTFADMAITGIAAGDGGWYGNVLYKCAPLPTDESKAASTYTVGFTKGGRMLAYSSNVEISQLQNDEIENSMGCPGILIYHGEITTGAYITNIPNHNTATSRICMGQNPNTKEVLILSVDLLDNNLGMTSSDCARILAGYGCDIAVEIDEGSNAATLYHGFPNLGWESLNNSTYAFWYISRAKNYTNDFQYEVNTLTQNYAQLAAKVAGHDVKIAEIEEEITNIYSEISDIKDNITGLESRIEAAESQITTIQGQISMIQGQISTIQGQISTINSTISSMQGDISSINSSISTITNNITQINQKIEELNEKIDSYTLPIATADTVGGIKVGSGLNITKDGTLSATGGSYTLPAATTSTLGGVIVGSGLSVEANGTLSATGGGSYTLPPATTSTLGGIKVGSRLSITGDGTLSANEFVPINYLNLAVYTTTSKEIVSNASANVIYMGSQIFVNTSIPSGRGGSYYIDGTYNGGGNSPLKSLLYKIYTLMIGMNYTFIDKTNPGNIIQIKNIGGGDTVPVIELSNVLNDDGQNGLLIFKYLG